MRLHITRICLGAAALAIVALPAACTSAPEKLPTSPALLQWSHDEQIVGYRNMEKVSPFHTIKRGARVFPLARAAKQIDVSFEYAGARYTTQSYMAAYNVSGLLVIKDGQIVLERYGLGRTAKDRWTSFSVAKSVTSTLVGAALRDGFIKSIKDPVTTYIPDLKGSAYDDVTVEQLLTMSSGVKWNEDYADPKSDVALSGSFVGQNGISPVVAQMRTLPREAAPGTKWSYKTGETNLIGVLVSNAVHKSLADYASEKIWTRFGMEQDAIWVLDSAGHEFGGCCISMTLRDYGRMGLFVMGGGVANGEKIVADGWIADATRKHFPTDPTSGAGYGYQWWTRPDGHFEAVGIFGQAVAIIPAENLVIVTNSAWAKATGRELTGARRAFEDAVRGALH